MFFSSLRGREKQNEIFLTTKGKVAQHDTAAAAAATTATATAEVAALWSRKSTTIQKLVNTFLRKMKK